MSASHNKAMIELVQITTWLVSAIGSLFIIKVILQLTPRRFLIWGITVLPVTIIKSTYLLGYRIGSFYWGILHRPLSWLTIRIMAVIVTIIIHSAKSIRNGLKSYIGNTVDSDRKILTAQ